jgi:hypothetical protein
MIDVKILSYKSPQRYAVRRTLKAAQDELAKQHPDFKIDLIEVKEVAKMLAYTDVLILPSLVVNEKLVCIGRFPKKDEIIRWLQDAIEEQS